MAQDSAKDPGKGPTPPVIRMPTNAGTRRRPGPPKPVVFRDFASI